MENHDPIKRRVDHEGKKRRRRVFPFGQKIFIL